MKSSKIIFLIGLGIAQTAFAQTTSTSANNATPTLDVVPALAGGVNVNNVQQCVKAVNLACQSLLQTTYEQYNACVQQQLTNNQSTCTQAQAIYQKWGMFTGY